MSWACHLGIHWIDFAEYSQMSTHLPGFKSFFIFLHHFVLAKLPASSIRVNVLPLILIMANNVLISSALWDSLDTCVLIRDYQ